MSGRGPLTLEAGIPASHVLLSGAAGGEYAGDLCVLDLTVEVKTPKDGSGFKQLESWLADHDILFLRRDRQKLLVLLPWDVYLRLMQGAVRRAVEAEVGRCQDTATN